MALIVNATVLNLVLSSGNTNTTYTSGNAWARWSAHNTPSSSGRFVFGRILIDRRVFNPLEVLRHLRHGKTKTIST